MKTIRMTIVLAILIVSFVETTIQAQQDQVRFGNLIQPQERRGWSPQAKGAAIGAGIGGAAGAIINKRNRVVGGIIGGAAGAAGGYAIGEGINTRRKNNERVATAEREATQARQESAQARQEADAAHQETAAARQETAEARHESEVAHQEAAAAANKPAVIARPAEARVAAIRKTPVPAVTGATAAAGSGLLTAAYNAQANSEVHTGNELFLQNTTFGDPNTAYPTSEVRRKSW